MSVWEELGLHVFCVWVCTCLHTCGTVCVHRSGVHSSVSASLFLPLCASPSESLSIPVFDSLILSLGMHVCLSTYMGGSLALLCFSASLCAHVFVIISPSLCMPLSFTCLPFPLPTNPTIWLPKSSVSIQVCKSTPFSQCPASLPLPAGLSLPLSISLFPSHQPSLSTLGSRFEPQLCLVSPRAEPYKSLSRL